MTVSGLYPSAAMVWRSLDFGIVRARELAQPRQKVSMGAKTTDRYEPNPGSGRVEYAPGTDGPHAQNLTDVGLLRPQGGKESAAVSGGHNPH